MEKQNTRAEFAGRLFIQLLHFYSIGFNRILQLQPLFSSKLENGTVRNLILQFQNLILSVFSYFFVDNIDIPVLIKRRSFVQ